MTYGGTYSGMFTNVLNNGGSISPSELHYGGGSIEVYSAGTFTGSGTWIGASNSWNTNTNWTDVAAGVPGDKTRGLGVDTASFNGAGVTAITLDINPNVAAVSFSGANYSLSGGTLVLQQGTGAGHVHSDGRQRRAVDCQRRGDLRRKPGGRHLQ